MCGGAGAVPAGGRFAPDAPPACCMGPVQPVHRLTPRAQLSAMLSKVETTVRKQVQWRASDSQQDLVPELGA